MRGGFLGGLRRRLSSLHRPAKIAYALLFTVGPGVAAYLTLFAPGGGGDTDAEGDAATSTSSTTTSASTTTTVPPADDPYLYANFEGVHPQRSQDCDGLLGLCMGQPINRAIQMFGPSEDAGFPQAVQPNDYQIATQCHRWRPPRFQTIDVCEADGAIVSVEISVSSQASLSLALPRDLDYRFPDWLANVAAHISDGLGEEAFDALLIPGEGEDVAAFGWYLPIDVEGPPDSVISISGRRQWDGSPNSDLISPCGPSGVDFRYSDVVGATGDIYVEAIKVARVAPNDLRPSECL